MLALWGASGLLGKLPTLEIWQGYAKDVSGTAIEECGHFLAEERPRALLENLKPFLLG
ncbi:hypothetical protein SAMN04489731_101309 [Amycolatopsis regifaucium]|nr:hypothetical protein SAMN04489731_101309 [Amycolatopsis regifaucium]